MKELIKRLTNLLAIKSLVTLLLVGAFTYLVCACLPIPEELQTIVTMVIGFYFGTQAKKE